MLNLGFDVNKNAKGILRSALSVLTLLFLFMICLTYYLFSKVIEADQQLMYIFAYINSNAYTTLFLAAFCLVLNAVFRRFVFINECIRYLTSFLRRASQIIRKNIRRKNFKTEEDDPEMVFDKESKAPEKLIIKLADMHDCLNDVVNDINQCFSLEVRLPL